MRISTLHSHIIRCEKCPRLREYCAEIAREKRRAYLDSEYWGRPVPGFGDPQPSLFILGLAPAAHGANRTGRIFTGDRSGDWLYRALHRSGFANQPTSTDRSDGLKLEGAYVSCSVRCAPPGNKPLPEEFARCSEYTDAELELFYPQLRVLVALGSLALASLEKALRNRGAYSGKKLPFAHGREFVLPDGRLILTSFHPSQQNTFTGRLTDPMFQSVFDRARDWITRP